MSTWSTYGSVSNRFRSVPGRFGYTSLYPKYYTFIIFSFIFIFFIFFLRKINQNRLYINKMQLSSTKLKWSSGVAQVMSPYQPGFDAQRLQLCVFIHIIWLNQVPDRFRVKTETELISMGKKYQYPSVKQTVTETEPNWSISGRIRFGYSLPV